MRDSDSCITRWRAEADCGVVRVRVPRRSGGARVTRGACAVRPRASGGFPAHRVRCLQKGGVLQTLLILKIFIF